MSRCLQQELWCIEVSKSSKPATWRYNREVLRNT